MASITEIRHAIAAQLEDKMDLVTAYSRLPRSTVSCPAVIIRPVRGQPVTMGRGVVTYQFDLVVLASQADNLHAQDTLDQMLTTFGANSPYAAIYDDKSVGLTNVDVSLRDWSEYGTFTFGDVEYLGASIDMFVATTGTS